MSSEMCFLALEIATIVACIWYANWLPAILVFGTTTSFYFMTVVCVKSYNKMEANLPKNAKSMAAMKQNEELEETEPEEVIDEEESIVVAEER